MVERASTHVGNILVPVEGGVLDQDGVRARLGGVPGSAHGGVIVTRHNGQLGALGCDEALRGRVHVLRNEDLDGEPEDAADAGDGAAVVAGGGGDESDGVGFGGVGDCGELTIEREVEALRHGAEGAPGGAEDLEGRHADPVAFFLYVDGGDAELAGNGGERDESGRSVTGKLAMEGIDQV